MPLGRVFGLPCLAALFFVSLLCSPVVASDSQPGCDGVHRCRPPSARRDKPSDDEPSADGAAGGYISAGYFTNWGGDFQPTDIVSKTLTHVMYAFADCDPKTGKAFLTNIYADQKKPYPGDHPGEPGHNLYGNFKQLYLLKQARRNLKVILSIGGYTYSQHGHFNFISNPRARANFVSTAINILEDNGLDGIDIDFEYPTASQKADFVRLIRELRKGLDQHASKKHDTVPYQLSLAVPAGAQNYVNFDVPAINPLITNWHLMAYDYAGSWSSVSDYLANLYRGNTKQGVDTDSTLKWYTNQGATKHKITMGIPLYGRAFENTGGIRRPFNGVGPGGGIWGVKMLPFAGAKVTEDFGAGGSYSYNGKKRELISFDTVNIVKQKARYVTKNGYGGTMYWDLSSDYVGSNSLVSAAIGQFGGLDQTRNHLRYPGSQFANMRSCMGGCPASAPTSTTTTAQHIITTRSPSSSPCNDLHTWGHYSTYPKGAEVEYGGFKWTATRLTLNEVPSDSSDVWKKSDVC